MAQVPFSLAEQNTVINFIKDNPEMSSLKAAEFLKKSGFSISSTSVARIRRMAKLPTARTMSATSMAKEWQKQGIEVTEEIIRSKFPDITRPHLLKILRSCTPQQPKPQKVEVAVAVDVKQHLKVEQRGAMRIVRFS